MTDLPPPATSSGDSFAAPEALGDPLANLNLEGVASKLRSVCTVEVLGIIEPADLAAALRTGTEPSRTDTTSADPHDIKRVRERHHSVARLIASGLSQTMVAQFCNLTPEWLSTLLNAPAMQDLVAFYRGSYTAGHELVAERLRNLGEMAVEKLEDRMTNEDSDNPLSAFELTGIAKLGLDRSGHGPQSTQHLIREDHIFDHAALQRKNREAREASASRIIDQPATPLLDASSETSAADASDSVETP